MHKLVANYLISDLLGILSGKEFIENELKITAENFAEFIKMIYEEEISSKVAKMVLAEMVNTGNDPSNIVDEHNWRQIQDAGELEKIIKNVLEKNQKAIKDYQSGNKNALQFLAGQIMKETRGTADPKKVREILDKII